MRSESNSRPCQCCCRMLPAKRKRNLCNRLCFRVLTNERTRRARKVRRAQARQA